jgi:hypothetical protein
MPRNFVGHMKHLLFLSIVTACILSGCGITPKLNEKKLAIAASNADWYKNQLNTGYELVVLTNDGQSERLWMDWDKGYRLLRNGEAQWIDRGIYKDSAGVRCFISQLEGEKFELKLFQDRCDHGSHRRQNTYRAIISSHGENEIGCVQFLSNPVLQNKWYWVKAGNESIQTENYQKGAPYIFIDIPENKIKLFNGDGIFQANMRLLGTRIQIESWKKSAAKKNPSGSKIPDLSQLENTTVEWFMHNNNLVLILPDESHWVFSAAY